MNKKTVSGIMLTLLLIGVLALTFNIQPVRGSGTIYIRSDGTVEGTDKIQRDGDLYTFTDNIYDGIVVEKDNIVVDGAGYTLEGMGTGHGIDLTRRSKVTIKDAEIKSFEAGIYLYWSSNNNISGNNITANNRFGIWLEWISYYNTISGNNITNNNNFGILLIETNDNIISGNNITNNSVDGIHLYECSSNTISGNNIAANNCGIFCVESDYNSILENTITNNGVGIRLFAHSSGNEISGNNIKWCSVGIDVGAWSSGNRIYHNNFVDNTNQASIDPYTTNVNVWDDDYLLVVVTIGVTMLRLMIVVA